MAPHSSKGAGGRLTPDESPASPTPADLIGPQSGIFSIPTQYIPEQTLRQMLRSVNSEDGRTYDEALEDKYRLKGVQLIDNVRTSLQLPVKTFDTAATYYHKFRTRFPSSEYNYEDAALASLFVACKVEDTIKRSKEILCAAHNVRQPQDRKSSDDKIFDQYSKFIVGLERHILETIGFDFRGQYPQKLLAKMIRDLFTGDEAKAFLRVAYDMSVDIYKTFAPIKQSTFTMVFAMLELTASLTGIGQEKVAQLDPHRWHTNRGCVLETMLDLLDLYTHFWKSTKLSSQFDINKMMDVKIEINRMSERNHFPRFDTFCEGCKQEAPAIHPITPGSATSPSIGAARNAGSAAPAVPPAVKRNVRTAEGSMRFVFDADAARKEEELVSEYFKDEMEEYEVEVEEKIPDEPRNHGRSNHAHRHHNNHDHGWQPYRNRHGHGHGHGHGPPDRPKGRKGGYF